MVHIKERVQEGMIARRDRERRRRKVLMSQLRALKEQEVHILYLLAFYIQELKCTCTCTCTYMYNVHVLYYTRCTCNSQKILLTCNCILFVLFPSISTLSLHFKPTVHVRCMCACTLGSFLFKFCPFSLSKEHRRDQILADRLNRQSLQEKRIVTQLMQVRKEKDNIRENR